MKNKWVVGIKEIKITEYIVIARTKKEAKQLADCGIGEKVITYITEALPIEEWDVIKYEKWRAI